MKSFWKSLTIRAALVVILSGALGVGFNFLYSKGIDPFRPLPPKAAPPVPSNASENPGDGAHATNHGFDEITIDQALEKFESGMAVFIDARMDKEFDKSRIPGALHLPPHAFERGRPEVLNYIPTDGSMEVVLYCNAFDCPLAEETARHLLHYGITNFVIFTGGWDEWVAAGHPVEVGE